MYNFECDLHAPYTEEYFIPFMEEDSAAIKLSIVFVITIILHFSDTALLSLFMIYCTTVATFNVSLLEELGPVLTGLFSEFPLVAVAAARVSASFTHVSAVHVVAGVTCPDAAQLRRAALVEWT